MNLPGKRVSGTFFHGSSRNGIKTLRPNSYGIIFLAQTKNDARHYAGRSGTVYEVQLADALLFDGKNPSCLAVLGIGGTVEENELWSSEYVEDWFLQEDMKSAGYDGFLVSDCRGDEEGINIGIYEPKKITVVKRLAESDNKNSVVNIKETSMEIMFRKTHGLEGDVQELYIPGKASLTYQEEDGMAILIKVETEEAQRNKGYASRLLKEFLAYADQEGLALDVSGYLPDGELYLKPLMSKLKPNYPGITWLNESNESKENTMRKLRETTGLPHYAKGVRRVVDGVVDEIAGLDHDMAVLCLAIWNLKLERTEEDPTEDLIDLWNSGKGNYCLSDGRRPGPKEAAALKALLAEFNDIIADHEENLRESLFGMRPHKAAFCRDANNKRLVPGNNVNTPDGEGEIDKVSGTRGEYFISVNGQEYRSTECYKLHEAKARAKFEASIVESESWLINGNSDKIIKKQYEDELKSLASGINYCKNAIAQKDIETWEKKEYQSVLTDYESREKDIKNILKGMK